MFQTSGIQQINQCRQVAQQLIQQTQQANGMYKQMLQREQQNATTLEQMAQRERQAVQMIEQSLHGHEMAIQRCQEVINLCNQMEQQLSHQFVPQGMQQHFNQGQMNQRINQH
ncbi:hypothetical protein [Litchfieldia alkalitelluris]|uniref:hypothetical protein n=1 Tax=Litchfieldia alkalitelluris TaxID=304268 RepID=UPI0009979B81|nr:hypothetical protein [Litchfieldia alkalitelluris]